MISMGLGEKTASPSEPTKWPVALPVIHVGSDNCLWCSLAMHHAAINTLLKDVQYAISKREMGSHPLLGTNDRGLIQPDESLIPFIV